MIGFILKQLRVRRDPVGYFRSLGVRIGENVRFFGPDPDMFSTEPYLVSIGDRCFITAGVRFVPHDGSALLFRREHPDLDLLAPIKVGNDVFIGTGAILLAGVTVGDRCIIGAGSVVTRDIPSGTVAAGVPAKTLKPIEEFERNAVLRSVGTKGMSEEAKRRFLLEKFGLEDPAEGQ